MQKKNTFDKATLKKIAKGALIAATGGAALGVLNYLGTVEIDQPLIASLIAVVVPVLTNAVKEFLSGK